MLLAKNIGQNIIFALHYADQFQLAVYCTRLLTADWQSVESCVLHFEGLNLDRVWDNCVAQIGGVTLNFEQDIAAQIASEDARVKLSHQIEMLEKKVRTERQPRHKLELFEELKALKSSL